MDILCQAKSGMGKTAVFVLATLQQLEPTENVVYVLVMCHTRELAFQISKEYERFSKYMPSIKVGVFFGGLPIQKDEEVLKNNCPHIVVGTPGRILALVRSKKLNLRQLKHFILDECDKMLELLGEEKFSLYMFYKYVDYELCFFYFTLLKKYVKWVYSIWVYIIKQRCKISKSYYLIVFYFVIFLNYSYQYKSKPRLLQIFIL